LIHGPIASINFEPKNLILATINRRRTALLVDTGAVVSCISAKFLDKIGAIYDKEINPETLTSADGRKLQVLGTAEVTVGLRGLLVPHTFHVIGGLNHNALIGLDFMRVTGCKLDMASNTASFFDELVVIPLQKKSEDSAIIRTQHRFQIPPRTEALIPVVIPAKFRSLNDVALVEPNATVMHRGCFLAKAVVNVKPPDRRIMCRILNPTDNMCTIRKGMAIATIGNVEVSSTIQTDQTNDSQNDDCESQKTVTMEEKIHKLESMGLILNRDQMEDTIFFQFCNLLYKFHDIFALSMEDLTGCDIIKCPVLIYPDAKLTRSRPYRLSDSMRAEVDKQLDSMLKAGIIAESEGSQFSSPIVMARKSNGDWRFCADMRRLNAVCYPLYHELPLIEDVTALMARNKVKIMSVIDLKQAYYQLAVTDATTHLTTFSTHRGDYKFLRLPMGLSQSPYYMSVALNKLFRWEIGSFMCVYLDDLLITSESPQKHLHHLAIVFRKLREANLKLHHQKCQFMLQQLRYLGHIFSAEGVQADPRKTAVVRNYPRPKSIKDVRSFLGLGNYFRRMIPNYADKAFALTKLLRKDTKFYWGKDQETSFQSLKDALINPPVMSLPDFDAEMILTCDASNISISFNLSQKINGQEHIIEYGARGFAKIRKNYTICEKELLAVITGVKHYSEYLQRRPFLIKTDNIALKYLTTVKHATGRLNRWNLLLSNFNYRVEHTKGKNNVPADRLSRIELPAPEDGIEKELDGMLMNINTSEIDRDEYGIWEITFGDTDLKNDDEDSVSHADKPADVNLDLQQNYDLQRLQEECPDSSVMIEYIRDGCLPRNNDASARKIIYEAERYAYIDGILYHLHLPRKQRQKQVDPVIRQLVVPRSLRELVLKAYHDQNAHVGAEKTYNTIRSQYYWKNLYADVYSWTKTCLQCQSGKVTGRTKAPLKSLPVESTIFERWHVDHLSLPRAGEFNYVLSAIDSFSLYSVLLAAKTTTAEETAKLLFDHLFMVYGCRTILSDRGSAFRSKLMHELCRLLNVRQVFTSARHPQTNSRAESYNKLLLNALRTHCEGQKCWPDLLSSIGFSFRTSIVSSLGCSPYRIAFGIPARKAFDNLLLPTPLLPTNVEQYLAQMQPQLQILRESVKLNQLQANERTTKIHNARSTTKTPTFKVMDRVWIFEPETSGVKLAHKILKKYKGPYLIIQANSDSHIYKLQDCNTQKILKSWINADRLKLYDNERDQFYSRNRPVSWEHDVVKATATASGAESAQCSDKSQLAPTANGRESPALDVTTTADQLTSSAQQSTGTDTTADDWYEIKDVIRHQRRKNGIYYFVEWMDGMREWRHNRDVTTAAVDWYWAKKRMKQKPRKQKK